MDKLMKELELQNAKYGDKIQTPANKKQVEQLQNSILSLYGIELSQTYIDILLQTNGFDNNGVVLYATEDSLLQGYDDRHIDGFVKANRMWHSDPVFEGYLFYAETETFLCVQSMCDKTFSVRDRDNFSEIIFTTSNPTLFFELILQLALGKDVLDIYSI